jgi:hypothetical protein
MRSGNSRPVRLNVQPESSARPLKLVACARQSSKSGRELLVIEPDVVDRADGADRLVTKTSSLSGSRNGRDRSTTRVNDAEDRGVRADAERQRQDGDGRKAGTLAQQPQPEAGVINDVAHGP